MAVLLLVQLGEAVHDDAGYLSELNSRGCHKSISELLFFQWKGKRIGFETVGRPSVRWWMRFNHFIRKTHGENVIMDNDRQESFGQCSLLHMLAGVLNAKIFNIIPEDCSGRYIFSGQSYFCRFLEWISLDLCFMWMQCPIYEFSTILSSLIFLLLLLVGKVFLMLTRRDCHV